MADTQQQIFSQSTLYIRISMSDISFATYDASTKSNFSFEKILVKPNASLAVNLKEAILQSKTSGETYKRVRVMVQSPTTLVPISGFSEDSIEEIYKFNFPEAERIRVFYDTLPYLNSVVLFSSGSDVCRVIEDHYQGVYYMSAITPILIHFAEQCSEEDNCRLFAYLSKEIMEVFAFNKGKLTLSNTYTVKSTEDIIYYLLFVAKSIGLDQIEDELYLTGKAREKQQLTEQLRNYIPNTFFVNPVAEYKRHPASQEAEATYDLITLITQTH